MFAGLEPYIFFFVGLLVLSALLFLLYRLGLFGGRGTPYGAPRGLAPAAESAPAHLPYHLRDDFLSPAEHNFYHVLREAVADWAVVAPKVNLSDLFYVQTGNQKDNRRFLNQIDRKHVDFLLCDARTMRPLMGVELDDRSHLRADRQQRDALVAGVFGAAGLPLVRVPVQASYVTGELAQMLRQSAAIPKQASSTLGSAPTNGDRPFCPRCGTPMVLRKASSGPRKGEPFWGCANYPHCRAMLAVARTTQDQEAKESS
jgi:hypothetical protein